VTTIVLRRAASGGDPPKTHSTTNRRSRRLFVRRLIAGLTAAVAGGVSSFALANGAAASALTEVARVVAPMVTPSVPDMPCSVSYQATPTRNPQQYQVRATIKNWASVTSILWVVYFFLPEGTVFEVQIGVVPMPEYGPGWFSATDTDKAIPPGGSHTFLVIYAVPPGTYGVPSRIACSIA
jgi:hypothetical protein